VTKNDMRCVDLGSELDAAAVASSCDIHASTSAQYVIVLDAQRDVQSNDCSRSWVLLHKLAMKSS
jgi:hypothetical protein